MQITVSTAAIGLLIVTNIIYIFLFIKYYSLGLKQAKRIRELETNPDGSMKVLNDLMTNERTILQVTRLDPGDIFLRSPRGV